MQMRSLRGKNLVAGCYDPIAEVLAVRFAKSGEYQYTGVPENIWVSLQRVPYPDKYFTQTVKGKFTSRKIEVEDESWIRERGEGTDGSARTSGTSEDAAGRVRNGSADGADKQPYDAIEDDRNRLYLRTSVSVGRCDAQGAGGRVVEVYLPQDGVEFHEDGHYYTLNGERIPFSLTGAIKLAGFSRQPQSAQEAEAWAKKAVLGTKVHQYSDWLDRGEIELDDLKAYPEYFNRVLGWQQFRQDFKFDPDLTLCEVPIAVKVNGMLYATKCDAFGVMGDEENLVMAVIDKKCSVNIEPHYALQTMGEALCFKGRAEALGMPLKRYIVQLLPEPNGGGKCYRAIEHTDRNDERIFVGACLANVYKRLEYGTLKVG